MKFIVKYIKSRNPLVVASRRRKAGSHSVGRGGVRQDGFRTLRREVAALGERSPRFK